MNTNITKKGTQHRLIQCLLLGFILIQVHQTAVAQTFSAASDSILWKVSGLHNGLNRQDLELRSEFKIQGDEIVWTQSGGDLVYEFSVNSRGGSWPDVSQDGSLQFNISWKTLPGTLVFKRENGQISIVMTILRDGANIAPFQFTVAEATKIDAP